jgi:hypothetical protein
LITIRGIEGMETPIVRILRGLLGLLGLAYIILLCLDWSESMDVQAVALLLKMIEGALALLCIVHFILTWRRREPVPEISAAKSGALVVFATGAAAALSLAWMFRTPFLSLAMLVITIGIAAAVFSFASRREDNIGEARFDTHSRTRGNADA